MGLGAFGKADNGLKGGSWFVAHGRTEECAVPGAGAERGQIGRTGLERGGYFMGVAKSRAEKMESKTCPCPLYQMQTSKP
jgi:hypothetical protein